MFRKILTSFTLFAGIIALLLNTSFINTTHAQEFNIEDTEAEVVSEVEPFQAGDRVILNADEVVNGDFFAAGEMVRISGTVTGDVYVAGGQISIDGDVGGDVLAAGGNVDISGNVEQDVRVASGQITISGTIGQNLTAVGGTIAVLSGADVGNNIVGGGGNVTIDSPVPGNMTIGAGSAAVSDMVSGNITAGVGVLSLVGNATVGGDVTIYSEEEFAIDEGKIGGTLTFRETPIQEPQTKSPEDAQKALAGIFTFFKLIGFVASLIVGLIFIFAYPNFSTDVIKNMTKAPWKSLGIGFVILLVAPIVAVLLMVTLVGFPLGLILLAIYGFVMYFGHILVALWAGKYIVDKSNQKLHDGWAFFIGLVVYIVVELVPVIGWVAIFLGMLIAVGALASAKMHIYKQLRKKKVL